MVETFSELLERAELHPGLVIIIPNEKPQAQRQLFRAAIQQIAALPSTVNKVVEVYSSQDVRICDLPRRD